MKTTLTLKPVVLSAIALVSLAACSGGGADLDEEMDVDPDPVVTPAFADPTATEDADLIVLSLDANATTVSNETGTLDREGDTLAFGSASGTISEDRTGVDLDDGAITFEGDADAFAVRFDATQDGTTTLGIIGVASDAANLPAGTATYAGDTVITAISGTDVYELSGTATITADFGGASSVTTELTGLSGIRRPSAGTAEDEDVADAGSLTISGSTISGTGFSGGTAALDSTELSLSGSETTALEGAFYGPEGEEVGGVFIVQDGTTSIFGDFLAE